jgi:N-acetylglutamate synthase-like GNAT family acetyltransferase
MITFPIKVRQAVPADTLQLNTVMRHASLAIETGEVLQRLRNEPELLQVDGTLIDSGQVVLAEADGVVVGLASFVIIEGAYAELDGMFVDPSYWRRGIGKIIFEAVERELTARQATGIRVVSSASAVDFYKSVGFSIVGEESTSLGPTVPVMTKDLKKNSHSSWQIGRL